jgi:prolyl-tRNA synthetase
MLPVIIEQHYDGRGIIWPRSVAPFEATIITIQGDDPEVQRVAEALHKTLGSSVALYDDRNESAGTKFVDADLIGIPDRFIIGRRGLEKGIIEYERRGGAKTDLSLNNILEDYGRAKGVAL